MARPRLEGMHYFSHDVDAHSEPEKIEPLMLVHGLAGYAHYFILLEMTYRTQNGCLDISQTEKRKLIARKMFCKDKQFERILEDEIKLGLFDKALYDEKGILTSNGIRKRRETVLRERTRKRRDYSGNNAGESAGETQEDSSHNSGERGGKVKVKDESKEREEGKPNGTTSPRRFEKVAFEKAETAWTQLVEALRLSEQGKLVIGDPLSRDIAIALGGPDKLRGLIGQNGDRLHQEFVTRYSVLDIAGFKAKLTC